MSRLIPMDGSAHPAPDDLVQPFQLENNAARGRLVRLGPAAQAVVSGHNYPEPVASLISEVLALTALVSGIFKFDGVFSLQAKGNGPVSLAVADMTSAGELRGYAQFDADAVAALGDGWRDGPVPHLLGAGYLAFTVDQGREDDRYQGIVDLTGATLADCAHNYFRQSDQFDGAVKLTAARGDDGWRAGGVMVQKMPPEGRSLISGETGDEEFEDAWRRAVVYMSSSRENELLDPGLHPHDLLYRLFHEDGVRVFEPQPLEMKCRCSAMRVETMLRSFPREEIEDLRIDDRVVVTCEFCGKDYAYSEADLDRLYGA